MSLRVCVRFTCGMSCVYVHGVCGVHVCGVYVCMVYGVGCV